MTVIISFVINCYKHISTEYTFNKRTKKSWNYPFCVVKSSYQYILAWNSLIVCDIWPVPSFRVEALNLLQYSGNLVKKETAPSWHIQVEEQCPLYLIRIYRMFILNKRNKFFFSKENYSSSEPSGIFINAEFISIFV